MEVPLKRGAWADAGAPPSSCAGPAKKPRLTANGYSKLDHILCQGHLRDAILREVVVSGESLDRFVESHPSAAKHAFAFYNRVQATEAADLLAAARQSFRGAAPSCPSKPPALPFTRMEMAATQAFLKRRVTLQRPFHEAHSLRETGRLLESHRLCAQIAQQRPEWVEAQLELLISAMLASDVRAVGRSAVGQAEEAARLHPNEAKLLVLAAESMLRMGGPCERVLVLLNRADQLMVQQPNEPAKTSAHVLDSPAYRRQLPRGQVAAHTERLAEPYAAYLASHLRGEALLSLGRYVEAFYAFMNAYRLESRDKYALQKASELCWLLNFQIQGSPPQRNLTSDAYLAKGCALYRGDYVFHRNYAAFLFESDEHAAARAQLERAKVKFVVDPVYAEQNRGIALCLIGEGRLEEAFRLLAPLTNSPVNRSSALRAVHVTLTLMQGRKVDGAKIRKWVDSCVQSGQPQKVAPQMHHVCGKLHADAGDFGKAIDSYTLALAATDARKRRCEILPIDELAFSSHLPLFAALCQHGQKQEAIAMLTRASALWPMRSRYTLILQQVHGSLAA